MPGIPTDDPVTVWHTHPPTDRSVHAIDRVCEAPIPGDRLPRGLLQRTGGRLGDLLGCGAAVCASPLGSAVREDAAVGSIEVGEGGSYGPLCSGRFPQGRVHQIL